MKGRRLGPKTPHHYSLVFMLNQILEITYIPVEEFIFLSPQTNPYRSVFFLVLSSKTACFLTPFHSIPDPAQPLHPANERLGRTLKG